MINRRYSIDYFITAGENGESIPPVLALQVRKMRKVFLLSRRSSHRFSVARQTVPSGNLKSMDWCKGKSTGNHGFYHQI